MIKLKNNFEFDEIKIVNFINLTDAEKEMVRNWRNNKDIRRWMYQDHMISRKEHLGFLNQIKQNNKNFWWLVYGGNEPLGVIYLVRCDFENRNGYLGIYSDPKKSGNGKILMDCLKKLAFEVAGFHTLQLEVMENNGRAVNFYKKSGFKNEGKLKEFVLRDRNWRSVVIMGMVNKKKDTR